MESLSKDTHIVKVLYNKETNTFTVVMEINEKTESFDYQPCLQLSSDYDPTAFTLLQLNSIYDVAENCIYEVFDKITSVRIGWIFPMQSLLSKEHDYHENIHFLRYAYVAIYKLLEHESWGVDSFGNIHTKDNEEQQIILILSNQNCNKIEHFNIDNYVVDLYSNGFVFTPPANSEKESKDIFSKKLKIKPLSSELCEEIFIPYAYKSILPQRNLPSTAKFHILYQIIEILISRVFTYRFTYFIKRIEANPKNFFDLKDDFSDMTKEKDRINDLMTEYSQISADKQKQCDESCKALLLAAGRKIKKNLPDNLYQVRCLIFHDYSSIPLDKVNLIDKVNTSFEDILTDILLTFQSAKSDE